MIADGLWHQISEYTKNQILSHYGSSAPQPDIKEQLNIPHVGLYIGMENSSGDEIALRGILHESLRNVIDSVDTIVKSLYEDCQKKNIDQSEIQTSILNFSFITHCTYIKNPLSWDENKDGVYFQWGQQYRGMYLPHQIKKMNSTKLEVLDKLCSWEAGVASSLWRFPEGLVWKLSCEVFTA